MSIEETKQCLKRINKSYLYLAIICLTLIISIIWQKNDAKRSVEDQKSINDASVMYDSGQKLEAIDLAREILAQNPNNKEVQIKLARFYYQNNDYDNYLKFVSESSLHDSTIYNMAANIYQDRGDDLKAEEYFRKAIEANRKNVQSYINLSAYFQSRGKLDKAVQILNEGMIQDSKSTLLLISAASVSIKSKQQEAAKEYLNTVLQIDPENTQAKTMLGSLL